jgi:hypothetical protein
MKRLRKSPCDGTCRQQKLACAAVSLVQRCESQSRATRSAEGSAAAEASKTGFDFKRENAAAAGSAPDAPATHIDTERRSMRWHGSHDESTTGTTVVSFSSCCTNKYCLVR